MAESWESLKEELISCAYSGKPSEIDVPIEVYSKCRKLYDAERSCSSPSRYPYLKRSAAYRLMVRFLRNNLTEDELKREVDVSEKLNHLQQALRALVKYGLNLVGSPNNKLFHRVKLTSPYFMYNVKKHCREGEIFLTEMGYQQKPGTSEMLYSGSGGTATVDRLHVAGTVVDILVIVHMLDGLLESREKLKNGKFRYDVETVFRDEFQEAWAVAANVSSMSSTYACSGGVAAGEYLEQPPTATAKQQDARQQQWTEQRTISQPPPPRSPLPSVGGREETSPDFNIGDLPRLYPSATPTAKGMPQPRARDTPAVQVQVSQPSVQPANEAEDMYGDNEMQPQVRQQQELPPSPQMQHSAYGPRAMQVSAEQPSVQTVGEAEVPYDYCDFRMCHEMRPQVRQQQQRSPQFQRSSYGPPAVQAQVKQPGVQTVDYYSGTHREMQPQVGHGQQFPPSLRMQHGTSYTQQSAPQGSTAVTHIPGYEIDSVAAQLQACHLSPKGAHGKSRLEVPSHHLGRSCATASSAPPSAHWSRAGNQLDKAGPPHASTGGHYTGAREGVDVVKVLYRDNADPEIMATGPREVDYYNADVISQSVVPQRRYSHELPATKTPMPAPRKGHQPQASLHHSLRPYWPPPQYPNAVPPAHAKYQPLGPTEEDTYTLPERLPSNTYQSLQGPAQHDNYEHLMRTTAHRNSPMDQHHSHPPYMNSSAAARHATCDESSSPYRIQPRQLPSTPHHSVDHSRAMGSGASSHLGNPNMHIPTSKPGLQQQSAAERHYCGDSSGSGGQNSSEDYSKRGPSSDEEHSFGRVTQI